MTQKPYQLGKNGTIIALLKQASELIKQFDQGDLEVGKIETQIQDSGFKCMLLSYYAVL